MCYEHRVLRTIAVSIVLVGGSAFADEKMHFDVEHHFSKADARCRGTGKISVEKTTTSQDRCTTCDGKGTVSVIRD